jgi:hypothetical protein
MPVKRLRGYLKVIHLSLSEEVSLMWSEDIIDFNGSSILIKDISILKKSC